MRGDLPAQDYILLHVTLIPEDTMGDLKTKPTQHSVKALRELGSMLRSSSGGASIRSAPIRNARSPHSAISPRMQSYLPLPSRHL